MFQNLTYDEIKFDKSIKLQEILKTEGFSDNGYFLEVDLNYLV